jgi:hypothetical protein
VVAGRSTRSLDVVSDLAVIARTIGSLPEQQRSGTLQIFGEWFGRPMDNFHICRSCEVDGDSVVLHFNDGETLRVWRPSTVRNQSKALIIPAATRVRWEWNYYGRPKTSDNLLFLDYSNDGTIVRRESNAPWHLGNAAETSAAAVQIVRM